jgi:hypothetical protein
MTLVGYVFAAAVALGIIFIGSRFLWAPRAAATGFGIGLGANDGDVGAYLSVKAVRDIASGLFVLLLLVSRQTHLLGWFMLIATIIPISDAATVLRHHGPKGIALGVHGATALFMLVTAALLLL